MSVFLLNNYFCFFKRFNHYQFYCHN